MQYYGFDWLAMGCSLLATYLLGSKSRYGFAVFIASGISWIIVGYLTNSWAMIVGNVVFSILHFRGLINWNKELRENPPITG